MTNSAPVKSIMNAIGVITFSITYSSIFVCLLTIIQCLRGLSAFMFTRIWSATFHLVLTSFIIESFVFPAVCKTLNYEASYDRYVLLYGQSYRLTAWYLGHFELFFSQRALIYSIYVLLCSCVIT